MRLDEYNSVNEEYRLSETVAGPYGVCAGHLMTRVREWMAEHRPEDLTVFVFEDGDVDHREIARILRARGIDRGEPVQVWRRQWIDEHGRRRLDDRNDFVALEITTALERRIRVIPILVDGAAPLLPGMIPDANRHTLLAQIRQSGWPAIDLGIVRDDKEAVAAALTEGAARCDALVTSGGVSVGDLDVVKLVLDDLSGGTMRWMQVAIKPAKPLAFGHLAATGTPVFGLPGNPVSAMVSFELFARPALRRMAGHRQIEPTRLRARAQADLPRGRDGKVHFVPVVVTRGSDGALEVGAAAGHQSHQLRAMAAANALGVLPDGEGVKAGEAVEVMLLGADLPGPAGGEGFTDG